MPNVRAPLSGPGVRRACLWLLLGLAACGSDPVEVVEDAPEGPVPLSGVVLATDTVDIPASSSEFYVPNRYAGTLPEDLGSTAGKLLVLSLRDAVASPLCPNGDIPECRTPVVMVVLERDGPELGRRPGRLTVSGPDPVTYYPWGNFRLFPEAEGT